MNDSIRGYSVAVAGTAVHRGVVGQLGSEIRQLVGILESADELQWALTDSSLPVMSRRAIVEELLTGKVGDLVVRLVSFVVGADKPSETPANLRWVAGFVEDASRAAGGTDGPAGFVLSLTEEQIGPSVGRQVTRERVNGYAAAVFGVVHGEGRLAEIEDELFRFARVVEGNGELRRALSDWNVPAVERGRMVVDLLVTKADPVTVALVVYAIRAGNVGSLVALLDWLVARAAAERSGRVGEVRAASPLDDEQMQRLARALARAVGHDVELRQVIDPSVIGGAQITVGEMVVDGTVKRRLEQARKALLTR